MIAAVAHIPHGLIFLAGMGAATAGIFAALVLVASAGHTERMFQASYGSAPAPDKVEPADVELEPAAAPPGFGIGSRPHVYKACRLDHSKPLPEHCEWCGEPAEFALHVAEAPAAAEVIS